MQAIRPRDIPAEDLAGALRAAAACVGDYRLQAATELVIRHGRWLADPQAVDQLIEVRDPFGEDLAVNWSAAARMSEAYLLDPEDRAVLAIAASIAAHGEPVDLFARLASLRRASVDRVLAAVSHATGTHHHVEHLGEPDEAGRWAITTTSPRVHVGALHPWPTDQN